MTDDMRYSDREAFWENVLERVKDISSRYVRRKFHQEEVVQRVIVKFLVYEEKHNDLAEKPSSFYWTSVKNAYRDILKSEENWPSQLDEYQAGTFLHSPIVDDILTLEKFLHNCMSKMTRQQLAIFDCLLEGIGRKEIGFKLKISERTVYYEIKNIKTLLNGPELPPDPPEGSKVSNRVLSRSGEKPPKLQSDGANVNKPGSDGKLSVVRVWKMEQQKESSESRNVIARFLDFFESLPAVQEDWNENPESDANQEEDEGNEHASSRFITLPRSYGLSMTSGTLLTDMMSTHISFEKKKENVFEISFGWRYECQSFDDDAFPRVQRFSRLLGLRGFVHPLVPRNEAKGLDKRSEITKKQNKFLHAIHSSTDHKKEDKMKKFQKAGNVVEIFPRYQLNTPIFPLSWLLSFHTVNTNEFESLWWRPARAYSLAQVRSEQAAPLFEEVLSTFWGFNRVELNLNEPQSKTGTRILERRIKSGIDMAFPRSEEKEVRKMTITPTVLIGYGGTGNTILNMLRDRLDSKYPEVGLIAFDSDTCRAEESDNLFTGAIVPQGGKRCLNRSIDCESDVGPNRLPLAPLVDLVGTSMKLASENTRSSLLLHRFRMNCEFVKDLAAADLILSNIRYINSVDSDDPVGGLKQNSGYQSLLNKGADYEGGFTPEEETLFGTVFLDEIGDLEDHVQTQLLRTLQEVIVGNIFVTPKNKFTFFPDDPSGQTIRTMSVILTTTENEVNTQETIQLKGRIIKIIVFLDEVGELRSNSKTRGLLMAKGVNGEHGIALENSTGGIVFLDEVAEPETKSRTKFTGACEKDNQKPKAPIMFLGAHEVNYRESVDTGQKAAVPSVSWNDCDEEQKWFSNDNWSYQADVERDDYLYPWQNFLNPTREKCLDFLSRS